VTAEEQMNVAPGCGPGVAVAKATAQRKRLSEKVKFNGNDKISLGTR